MPRVTSSTLLAAGAAVLCATATGCGSDDDAGAKAPAPPPGTRAVTSQGASFAVPQGWTTKPRTEGEGVIATGPAGTGGLAPLVILARSAGGTSARDAADLNVTQAKVRYPGVQVDGPRTTTVPGADDAAVVTYRFPATGAQGGLAQPLQPGDPSATTVLQRVVLANQGDVQRSFTVQVAEPDAPRLGVDALVRAFRIASK